jgi:glutamate racemase
MSPGEPEDSMPRVSTHGRKQPRILIFDSGLGGLTVFREVRRARPDADYVYAADDAFFPYSDHDEQALTHRVLEVMGRLIEAHSPDLIVIACNTASTIVLPALRARFEVPFVGTVPAIKPACALSSTRLVSVLGTEATVSREYTQALIRDFAQDCDVTLVGSDHLATMAERALNGQPVDRAQLATEVQECFQQQDGSRTDVVVLACTHFPLLLDDLERVAPWPVQWVDPAEAIARRVVDLLGPAADEAQGEAHFQYLSGRTPSQALQDSLVEYGLTRPAVDPRSRGPQTSAAPGLDKEKSVE